ncbi:MAG TPA: ABC transporter permease [Terracidiphilus sp.]|jgi:predicted permease|nr:ABC transporter permease [Terracidiphilus sp.]
MMPSLGSFAHRKKNIAEELESHLRMATEDLIERGMKPEEARVSAIREFGNVALVEDIATEMWGWLWVDRLLQDLRYAVRQMRRSPGFAATVIGTLALGIGAAAAMFTVVDHVLLRPLPYRDAGRLVAIQEHGTKDSGRSGAPWLDIEEWMARSRSFSQIAFSNGMPGRNFLEGSNGGGMQISAEMISPNLFATLGVSPSLGRDFVEEPAGSAVGKNADTVILSDAAWKAAYGGDLQILGKNVKINNKSYLVVGVMPPGIEIPFGPSFPQVWTTITLDDEDKTRYYNSPDYSVIARLRPEASIKTAQAEMTTIQKGIAPAYTDARVRQERSDAEVKSYADSLVAADISKALLALLAAVGVLWLIASVNATNLLLARGAARQREVAMRGALGASRSRILQQLIVESLVLSGAGALLGTGLALGALRLVSNVKPAHLNVDLSAHVNFTILAVLCGLTLLTALVSSAWPAFLAACAPIEPALRQGGQQSGSGRRQNRARSILVICEVALSLTLLMACGLLLRTIYTLRHVPLGYRTDHIMVAHLATPSYRYSGRNMIVDLYQPLLDRVQHLQGVEAAGFMSEVPLGQSFSIKLTLAMNGQSSIAVLKPVSPDIRRIFGFKMVAGRFFDDQDTATSEPVVVVNLAYARLHSPNAHDPAAIVGQRFMNLRKNTQTKIIGIIDDERQAKIGEPSQPEVEICLRQLTPDSGFYQPSTVAMDLAVRTERAPDSIIPELRSILGQANPDLSRATFNTMEQVVEDSFGSQRLAAHLLEIFGGVALLLCLAGLYGLLRYTVTQRTREMGVRIALGAQRRDVLWLVMRQAAIMLLVGLTLGAALALPSARLIQSFLYGVTAHDGWTLGCAAALLLISGLSAAYLPARGAASVDPIKALRAE